MADMVRIFNTACKEWWLPGHGSGMTKNIEEAWVLPLEQAEALTTGATVLIFEPVGPTPTTPDELLTARASEARLREALEELLECARLRGDNQLPNPCDDPILWTARMQHAWDDCAEALSGSSGEWLERQLAEARRKALLEAADKADKLVAAHDLAYKRADAAGNEDAMCFIAGYRDGATGVVNVIRQTAQEADHA